MNANQSCLDPEDEYDITVGVTPSCLLEVCSMVSPCLRMTSQTVVSQQMLLQLGTTQHWCTMRLVDVCIGSVNENMYNH